jgi:hypothetical protein
MNTPAPAAGPTPAQSSKSVFASGLAPALGAYLIWGFLPLYLLLVKSVPPFEFVGWRIIWTLPLCLLIVAYRRQFPELLAALRSPRSLLALLASAVLIAINWIPSSMPAWRSTGSSLMKTARWTSRARLKHSPAPMLFFLQSFPTPTLIGQSPLPTA